MTGPTPRVVRKARGTCTECGRSYRVDTKNRMQTHPELQDPRATVQLPGFCPGSRKPPKEGP